MVHRIATSGAGIEAVVGKAGAGKTFALDAARAAWQSAGPQVIVETSVNGLDSTGVWRADVDVCDPAIGGPPADLAVWRSGSHEPLHTEDPTSTSTNPGTPPGCQAGYQHPDCCGAAHRGR